ncbi:MAG: hypothetical protein KDD69_15940, partial [Bdellovibrionales bacterium]|nr:hypothetical protein [Bdellovibrionales bacterium]
LLRGVREGSRARWGAFGAAFRAVVAYPVLLVAAAWCLGYSLRLLLVISQTDYGHPWFDALFALVRIGAVV